MLFANMALNKHWTFDKSTLGGDSPPSDVYGSSAEGGGGGGGGLGGNDLVLSVMKSPVRHEFNLPRSGSTNSESVIGDELLVEDIASKWDKDSDVAEETLPVDDVESTVNQEPPEDEEEECDDDTCEERPCINPGLRQRDQSFDNPFDETTTIDMIDPANQTPDFTMSSTDDKSSSGFVFLGLKRFKRGRFVEAHHKRCPTPIKRRYHHTPSRIQKSKSSTGANGSSVAAGGATPYLDGADGDDIINEDVVVGDADPGVACGRTTHRGVPDPYYPIYLPIDQAFKAKYVFHHKKGKTFQERVYVFLEHPGGWLCFIYHFAV